MVVQLGTWPHRPPSLDPPLVEANIIGAMSEKQRRDIV